MKKFLIQCLISAISLFVVPISIYSFGGTAAPEELHNNQLSAADTSDMLTSENSTLPDDNIIKVFNSDTGNVMELDFREYIMGVVAAEMPAEFHSEALSALTAAAATLARKKLMSGSDASLEGAVISTDPKKHQAYMSKEVMKEKWGDDFDTYYQKLSSAVDKAIDCVITYKNELIVAAYHAISPGKTENAENVWSAAYPYLISVESTADKLSPRYETTAQIPKEEFISTMESEGCVFENNEISLSAGEYTDAGTLKKIRIGSKDFSGAQLRAIFGLRSNAVTVTSTTDNIIFTVKGYGHGVGMSQYGADYYARQGMSWQEIICHYYPGTVITNYNSLRNKL